MNERLERAIGRLGIQPRPLLGLLRALLLVDLRGQHYGSATNTGAGAVIPPLYWVVGQFLAVSWLLTAAMVARVDVGFFAAMSLGVGALMVLSAVVVEFHEAVLDPSDVEILGHRPILPRTYAGARMANLGFYVGLMTAAVTLFPSIVGLAWPGIGAWWLLVYPVASVAVCAAVASAAALLWVRLGAGRALAGLRALLAWIQIVAILVVFYGGQLMLRNGDGGVERWAARPPLWFERIPTTPVGRWVARVAAEPALEDLGLAAALLAGAAAVGAAALLSLSAGWSAIRAGAFSAGAPVPDDRPPRGTIVRPWLRRLTRDRAEAVGAWLVLTALVRDAELRMRSVPALATAAAAVLLGLGTRQYGDPLAGLSTEVVLPVAAVVLLAAAIPQLAHNLSVSRDHAAAWLLGSAPASNASALRRGARRAAVWVVMGPPVLILAALGTARWDPWWHGPAFGLGAWLVVVICAQLSFPAALPGLPLSRRPRRGGALGPVVIVAAGTGGVASLGMAGLVLASPLPGGLPATLVGLVVVSVVLDLRDRRRGRR